MFRQPKFSQPTDKIERFKNGSYFFATDPCDNGDINSIRKFLGNKSLVKIQLAKLENELIIAAGDAYDRQTGTLRGYHPGKPFKQHKLFSNFFRMWAKENGFTDFIKLKEFVIPDEFYENIARKILFFDTVFNSDNSHGEVTHSIQIYCVTEYSKANPGFLSMPMSELYAMIGKHDGIKNSLVSYWLRAFESGDTYSVSSYHDYLSSYECEREFPVLSSFITSRMRNMSILK